MKKQRLSEFSGALLLSSLQLAPRCRRYVVALSGGCDSVALLHSLAQLRSQLQIPIAAIHIDHGLSEHSLEWAEFCQQLCFDLGILFKQVSVKVDLLSGKGIEAAARDARYEAFSSFLQVGDLLLLAHHQDDQAETLLLNLFKGAGLDGLAGMPRSRTVGHALLYRPLLDVSRKQLEQYANNHKLSWIDDPSNQDQSLDRNFVRQTVLPIIEQRFGSVKSVIARASTHCRHAAEMQGHQAHITLGRYQTSSGRLNTQFAALPEYERGLVLRSWLKQHGVSVSSAQLDTVFNEVVFAGGDRVPQYRYERLIVSRFQEQLYVVDSQEFDQDQPQDREWSLTGPLYIPEIGMVLTPQSLLSYFPELNESLCVSVRFRRGGERFKASGSNHHKKLKDCFQKWGITPWRRRLIPLIYMEQELLTVFGYGVASRSYSE